MTKIGEGKDAVEMGVDYLLYLPQNYEEDTKWPLLIFLHGTGERGQDLEIVRRVGLPSEIEKAMQGSRCQAQQANPRRFCLCFTPMSHRTQAGIPNL